MDTNQVIVRVQTVWYLTNFIFYNTKQKVKISLAYHIFIKKQRFLTNRSIVISRNRKAFLPSFVMDFEEYVLL